MRIAPDPSGPDRALRGANPLGFDSDPSRSDPIGALVIFILTRLSIYTIIRVILSYSQCLPRGDELGQFGTHGFLHAP